jgi:beta-fructofuranosidase
VISPTIHHTLPYEDGSETVSIAVSTDAGATWQKEVTNPILKGPPTGEKVTGFRDPSISTMPSIDRLLGRTPGQYVYGTLSGGFAKRTPTAFLYSIPANNMCQWNYLGSLIENVNPDIKWCGEGGQNFECCSLFELEDQPTLLTSTEGGERRWSLWMQGQMELAKGSPQLRCEISGVLDWGCFYAASSSEHPLDKRRLLMGKDSKNILEHMRAIS